MIKNSIIFKVWALAAVIPLASSSWGFEADKNSVIKGNLTLGPNATADTGEAAGNLTVNGTTTLKGTLTIQSVDDSTGILTSTETFTLADDKIPTTAAVVKAITTAITTGIVYAEKKEGGTTAGVAARIEKCWHEGGYLASLGELNYLYDKWGNSPNKKSDVTLPTKSDMSNTVSSTLNNSVEYRGVNFSSSGTFYDNANYSDTKDGFVCLGPIIKVGT